MAVTIAVAVTVPHSRTLCCAVWQAKSTIELDLESPDAEDRHCGFVDLCRNTRLRDVRVQVMDDWDDDQLPDNSKIACWYFEVDGSRISNVQNRSTDQKWRSAADSPIARLTEKSTYFMNICQFLAYAISQINGAASSTHSAGNCVKNLVVF